MLTQNIALVTAQLTFKNQVFPTSRQILTELKARDIVISERTLIRHRKKLDIQAFLPQMKSMTMNVLAKIYEGAVVKGNSKQQKLWLEYVEGFKPGLRIENGDFNYKNTVLIGYGPGEEPNKSDSDNEEDAGDEV